ncbi:uncharacterized protein L203_103432 [Cryptococcus depauperatus CBS 7841]|uniref:DUF1776-domain-containing protein n=1 Tax=Cryptococcus depauperatus CBS 7841 TaxID=1295531 RepID=A0AAJ8M226_9TREE
MSVDTLNVHGPPSISLPFPPFGGKEVPPPPPPPPPPSNAAMKCYSQVASRSERFVKSHYVAVGVAVSVGIGLAGFMVYKGVGIFGKDWKVKRHFGHRGVVQDGMLKEAIVILTPSPMPALLIPLASSMMRAGYIVLIAVTNSRDAQSLERRLGGLEERSSLRVLIYDPDDPSTFPPFHRSLLATLTLRFPVSGKYAAGDPYNPQPDHLAHIHAFLSLYPLHPSPPTQPGALPALPTLLAPNPDRSTPILVNFYPSGSVLTVPNTFASQVLASNHVLLGKNLSALSGARVISVYVGNVNLPTLPAILSHGKTISRRQLAKERLAQDSTPKQKVSIIGDYLFGSISTAFSTLIGVLGLGSTVKDYKTFEKRVLGIVKSSHGQRFFVGQRSFFPYFISRLPLPSYQLPLLLTYLPQLPSSIGPTLAEHPKSSTRISSSQKGSSSERENEKDKISASEESEHEGAEDLVSSIHTGTSLGSERTESSEGASGLEGSWVGLDDGN